MIFSFMPAAIVKGLKTDPNSKVLSTSGFVKTSKDTDLPYVLGSKFGNAAIANIFPVLGSIIIAPPPDGFHSCSISLSFFSRKASTFGSSVSTTL